MPHRAKILLAYAILLLVTGLMSLQVYRQQAAVDINIADLADSQIPQINTIRQLNTALAEQERLLYELYATADSGLHRKLDSAGDQFNRSLQRLKGDGKLKVQVAKIVDHNLQITAVAEQLRANMAQRVVDWDLARDQLVAITANGDLIRPLLEEISVATIARASELSLHAKAQTQFSIQLVIGASVLMLALAAFLAYFVDRYLAEARIRARLARYAERSPNPILSFDLAGNLQYSNPSSTKLSLGLGFAADPTALLPENFQQLLQALTTSSSDFSHWQQQWENATLNYSLNYAKELASFQLHIEDVTKTEQALRELQHQALHDWLTLLPNRRKINQQLAQAIKNTKPFAILLLRIDRFGLITASHGYDFGDELIKAFAQRLQRWCQRRPEALTAYRFEGTTFAITAEDIDSVDTISNTATKLRRALAAPVALSGQSFNLTTSVGVALFPQHGALHGELLLNSEAALNHVEKGGGDNQLCYNIDLQQYEKKWLVMQTELRSALSRNEMRLHYQPKVAVNSQDCYSCEALLRWFKLDGSLVSPAEFIPVAEQTGEIVNIGEWVFAEACRQQVKWSASKQHIAINLSVRQIQQQDFLERIDYWLQQTGAKPEFLELEITESLIMENIERASVIMRELKARGFSLAIDDFGTGYSSLSLLRHFPIDTLKIDRAFIIDITNNPQDQLITQTIIDLAHNLQLKVVAEGVETQAQYQLLTAQGCNYIQGFLISKPVDAKAYQQSYCLPDSHQND